MLRKLFLPALLMAGVFSFNGYSQTNSVSANADADMSLPISINPSPWGVVFGGFMPGATAGTVILDAHPFTGTRTSTGGVTLVIGDPGEPAYLFVQGEPNAEFDLVIPTDPVTITRAGGSETMTLTDITLAPTPEFLVLSAQGDLYVYFGGTLNVAANQTIGLYLGNFVITASYL